VKTENITDSEFYKTCPTPPSSVNIYVSHIEDLRQFY
jgi:hypothetical protein